MSVSWVGCWAELQLSSLSRQCCERNWDIADDCGDVSGRWWITSVSDKGERQKRGSGSPSYRCLIYWYWSNSKHENILLFKAALNRCLIDFINELLYYFFKCWLFVGSSVSNIRICCLLFLEIGLLTVGNCNIKPMRFNIRRIINQNNFFWIPTLFLWSKQYTITWGRFIFVYNSKYKS